MEASASSITASLAVQLASQGVAANIDNRRDPSMQLSETENSISDTLETQDREPDSHHDRSQTGQAGQTENLAEQATGDRLDLTA